MYPGRTRQRKWFSKENSLPSPPSTEYHQPYQEETIRDSAAPGRPRIQSKLIDGQPGSRTRAAIRNIGQDNGLQVDGRPSVLPVGTIEKSNRSVRLHRKPQQGLPTDAGNRFKKNQDTKDQQEPDFVLFAERALESGIPSLHGSEQGKTAEDGGPYPRWR